MKLTRILSACALILFAFNGVAQANSFADPAIIIGGTGSFINFTPGHTSVSLTFNTDPLCNGPSFTTLNKVSLPSMACGVTNNTGAPLMGFTFTFNTPQNNLNLLTTSSFAGLGTWFSNCNNNNNCTSATFTLNPALLNGVGFDTLITFVGFAPGTVIGLSAVPEPATLTLFASGLGALLLRRRTRKAIG